MQNIRIHFTDFWHDFNPRDNFFFNKLSLRFIVIIDEIDPELVIYGNYGSKFLKFPKAIRVIYISENVRPSYLECDYSLSFEHTENSKKNLRLPLYVLYYLNESILLPKNPNDILKDKKGFCSMVVSNGGGKVRNEFFDILNKLKKVNSGGKFLNNIGGPVENKLEFIKDYRFSIAFENGSFPGYTTEKIFEPMKVNSIPIYWGSNRICEEFNVNSFINVHSFDTLKSAAEEVIKIENDEILLTKMLSEPWFINNLVSEYFSDDRFNDFFDFLLKNKRNKRVLYFLPKQTTALYSVFRKKRIAKKINKPYWNIS